MNGLPTSLHLEVATPLGQALSLEVDYIEAPSVWGQFGVFPGHLPLLASLKIGIISYRQGGHVHRAAIGAGFAEAGPDRVRIITDRFSAQEEIDAKNVRTEHEKASLELKDLLAHSDSDPNKIEALEHDIAWCQARLDIGSN
ncbi:MAG: ATP synthase F1 subunit epsilon [Myxococcales bacterium]|nr:MAG: ATP synthase F1 subunit epsilon [Myxococcales bacterium]